jgi:hypothetical protein
MLLECCHVEEREMARLRDGKSSSAVVAEVEGSDQADLFEGEATLLIVYFVVLMMMNHCFLAVHQEYARDL